MVFRSLTVVVEPICRGSEVYVSRNIPFDDRVRLYSLLYPSNISILVETLGFDERTLSVLPVNFLYNTHKNPVFSILSDYVIWIHGWWVGVLMTSPSYFDLGFTFYEVHDESVSGK